MHVFLDLDGTLTDPKIGITRSVAFALERLGIPVPDLDDLTWVIGPPLIESFALLGADDPGQALAHYRERFAEVGLFENSVYSGILDVMHLLGASGYSMYLATAKPHVYARKITAHFGLARFLSHEFGPELDGTRNDKGELLRHAMSVLGIEADQSVMVGDRIHDFKAARSVGMRSIAVTWGYGDANECTQADIICTSPSALPEAIKEAFQH